jgi:hypothetical protein
MIHYEGTTDPADNEGSNVWYQTDPPNGQQYGLFLPTTYNIDADPVAGLLTVNLWEVFSLPPNSFTVHEIDTLNPVMSLNASGDWEGTIGDALFTMRSTYPLNVFINYTPKVWINSVLQSQLPQVDDYYMNSLSLQIPEPPAWMLAVGSMVIFFFVLYRLGRPKQPYTVNVAVPEQPTTTTQVLMMAKDLLPMQRVHLINRLNDTYCEACGEALGYAGYNHECPDDDEEENADPEVERMTLYNDDNANDDLEQGFLDDVEPIDWDAVYRGEDRDRGLHN